VLTVTDAGGCQDIDSVHLTYHSTGPIADAGFGNNSLCTGGSILLGGSPTAIGGTSPFTYSWAPATGLNNPASAYPTATITANTTYSVTVTDATGCQDIDSVHLVYHSAGPVADAGFGNSSLCTGGTILLGGAPTATGGTPPYFYSWLPANGLNHISIANPLATVTTNMTYSVTVTDAAGCKDIDTVILIHNSAGPHVDAGAGNNALCYNRNIVLGGNPTASGGTLPYTYSWVPVTGLNTTNGPNPSAIGVTANIVYYLTVIDAAGCTNVDSAVVNIIGTGVTANFTENPTVGLDPLAVHFTNQSIGNALTYQWFFGDSDTSTTINPNHTFHNLGSDTIGVTILLVATDVNGCKDTAKYTVHIDPSSAITYANVFTPNGDGINDIFNFDVHNLTITSASIFNRWGQKVYDWSVALAGWDGRTASGVPAPDGVYFFIFNAVGVEGKRYTETGYILLTR
jgi:gliding motility-associated-like protein